MSDLPRRAGRDPNEIAHDIRVVWQATRDHFVGQHEGYIATGHLINEAREVMPADRDYGAWFEAQGFGFTTEWARKLALIAKHQDKYREAVATAVATGTDEVGVNAFLTSQGVLGKGAHVSHNSGENEWYTPAEIIESARRVMGGIDLDPASTPKANEVVKATTFYTKEDNGLDQGWHGRVWMNPPYARPLIDDFCEKLAEEYANENIEQAIVLVNNATDTSWFGQMAEVAGAACFTRKRVRFWHPERESAPLQGQAILYFGPSVEAFLTEFKAHGHTWVAL